MPTDANYILPRDVQGKLRSGSVEKTGPIAELLDVYGTLPESDRRHAVIMLDKHIAMPADFTRPTAMNLFDGEATILLPYLG
jgi:hypothetical protein